MEPYNIELFKDIVKEACEESAAGLYLGQNLHLRINNNGSPDLYYDNTRIPIYSWSAALKLYRKMKDPNARLYHTWLVPKISVVYTPDRYLVLATSVDEALNFTRRIFTGMDPIAIQRADPNTVSPNTLLFIS